MDTQSLQDPLDLSVHSRKLSNDIQRSEKPLPPSPPSFDHKTSESPILNTPISTSEHALRPSLSGAASFQRPKKRIYGKTRPILIGLPIENESGRATTRESYLTPEDVAKRIDDWKNKGYNTEGFVLAPASTDTPLLLNGQSRPVHPDPEDEKRERADRTYNVSIPDRREWEAYVNHLKEEKLRALGVSFGDEELPRKSPAPSLMSRQASSQSSAMLISPALAPLPAQAAPFPPNFHSPVNHAAQIGKPAVSHFPRYSMAMPFGEKSFSPSTQFPQSAQSPGPGAWSPHQFMASPPGSRVASPLATGGHMQDLKVVLSPVVPTVQTSVPPVQNNIPPPAQTSLGKMSAAQASFLRQQQALQQAQQLQAQRQLQQQQIQQQTLQPQLLPVTGNAQKPGRGLQAPLLGNETEIASPIPRGHRQNPSETLQKEVDENESYIKPTISRDPSQQDSMDENKDGTLSDDALLAHNVHASFRDKKVDASDLDTNPSLVGTPDLQQRGTGVTQNGHFPKLSTSSGVSTSKLNVNAPEFKFEPKNVFNSGAYAPFGNQQPISPTSQASSAAYNFGHSRKPSSGPTKFNVAAPVFTPGASRKATIPSGEFSFSTSGPPFRPEAPTFKPSGSGLASGTEPSSKENPVDAVKKIFGEIKFHEVIRPTKKSKAVSIVRPDNSLENQGEYASVPDGQEDESGRITQADGRQKRARRETPDGDQVPLFASPKQSPWMVDGYDDRAAYFSRTPSPKPDENNVDAATELLEELLDDMSATEVSELMREDESVDTDAKPFEPHAFQDIDEAASFNAARPRGASHAKAKNQHQVTAEDVVEATKEFLGKAPQYQAAFDQALKDGAPILPSPDMSIEHGKRSSSDRHKQDGVDRVDHARQDILDGVRYVEPSYQEIDAIMKHLNRDDSDIGVERKPSPASHRSPSVGTISHSTPDLQHTSGSRQLLPPANIRSDAPSPSPNRLRGNFQYLPPVDMESADASVVDMVAQNARYSPSYRPSATSPPVHRLNSPGSRPPSDWDDAISSVDEAKFRSRTAFFDHRVNDLVGGIVQQRLGPLEKTLSGIQDSLAKLSGRSTSRRPRSSGKVNVEHSDADDEEETSDLRTSSRMKSPLRDRKYEQLKLTLNEIIGAQQHLAPASHVDGIMTALTEVQNALGDIQRSAQTKPASNITSEDIRTIIEEVMGRQRGKSGPVKESSQAAIIEKNQLQIAGLESMLKAAEARADDEMKARRSTEDALADNQRLLRSAMQEAAQQRESAEATERSLEEYHEERHQALQRTAMLEGSQESLEKSISDLTQKNAAMEGTLAEYRLFSDQWRTKVDDARHENKNLRRSIDSLKAELEESIQGRQALRSKFEHLTEDLTRVSQEMNKDQSRWLGKEEEHNARLAMLSTRLESEARTRERLELEIERLEAQEKEAMKARFMVEQTQKANSQLETMVAELRSECHEHQKTAARFERELHDAREAGRMEVQRTRIAMEGDIEAANNHVKIVRDDLESVVARLHKQVEAITADANTSKARQEFMLEEAAESRTRAVQEAADAKEAALQEHYRFHERTIAEQKAQHERELNNVLEDKQRSETYFGNRLSLADEKIVYYQDKIADLEERLEIAKSAAHAAAQAAQSKKAMASPVSTRTQLPASPSNIPEKISPQALRESIMVLQEQLQERESRIEQLESELSAVDTTAPAKLKDADIEITWLRELLGVRIDDLEDIIRTLSKPSYDREAVKDAVIRLKANLQMEQQEKERALAGGQTFPSLGSISNLAASPKALPLAAAAAWGNWRKGREQGYGNLSAIANGSAHQHQTPSKTSPQSFFAGLMTPPSTDMRATPLASNENRRPTSSSSSRQRVIRDPITPRHSMSSGSARNELIKQEPVTPPLMRKASYDLDATESAGFGGFGDEGVEGSHMGGDDEPFGPKLGGIVGGGI